MSALKRTRDMDMWASQSKTLKEFITKSKLPYHAAYLRATKFYPYLIKSKQEIKDKVELLSKEGYSIKAISNKLGLTPGGVRYYRYKYKTSLIGPGSGMLSKITVNPFSSSELSYFWVGFLLADGHISKAKYAVDISQKEEDSSIVDEWISFLGVPVNKGEYTYTIKDGTIKKMVTARIGSKLMHDYLKSIGFTHNKATSIDLKIPLNWPIVIGWWYGDGSVRLGNRSSVKITTGSFKMVNQLVSFLNREGCTTRVKTKGTAFDVFVDKNDCLKFCNKLISYKLPLIQRKYNIIAALIVKIKDKTECENGGNLLTKDNTVPSL